VGVEVTMDDFIKVKEVEKMDEVTNSVSAEFVAFQVRG
jgi:hypothetical protein